MTTEHTDRVRMAILSVLASMGAVGPVSYDDVRTAIRRSIGRIDDRFIGTDSIASHAWRMALEDLVTLHPVARGETGRRIAITPKGAALVSADQAARIAKAAVDHDLTETAAKWRTMRVALSDLRDANPSSLPSALAGARQVWMETGCPGIEG